MGHWKAVRQDMLRRNNPDPLKMELYNLQEDIGESRDLSGEHPEHRRPDAEGYGHRAPRQQRLPHGAD